MKKRVYINTTRFENLNPSGEAMWKEREQRKFVIELSENLVDPGSMIDSYVYAKMLESKNTSTEKFIYDGHEIEPQIPEILGTEEDYLDAVDEVAGA